jgi:hypothetical protein
LHFSLCTYYCISCGSARLDVRPAGRRFYSFICTRLQNMFVEQQWRFHEIDYFASRAAPLETQSALAAIQPLPPPPAEPTQ